MKFLVIFENVEHSIDMYVIETDIEREIEKLRQIHEMYANMSGIRKDIEDFILLFEVEYEKEKIYSQMNTEISDGIPKVSGEFEVIVTGAFI